MLHRLVAVASGIWVAWIGTMVMAATPGAATASAGPATTRPTGGPRTERDLYREVLQHNRNTIVDAYRAVGSRNAKWDAPAIQAMEILSRQFAHSVTPSLGFGDEAPPDLVAMGRLANECVGQGCDDAMVQYTVAFSLAANGQADQARAMMTRAVASFERSKYSPQRLYGALNRLYWMQQAGPERVETWKKIEATVQKVVAGPFPNDGVRTLVRLQMYEMMEKLPLASRESFVQIIEKSPGVDAWIAGCMRAGLEIKLAWDARGFGWAATVSPESWNTFEEHLSRARRAAEAAYASRPALPEAPTAMITIAMGQGDLPAAKKWFNRAIAAQIDYGHAYTQILSALQPRWGGSPEEMLQVGVEAARTKRFDTSVPWEFIHAVIEISTDEQGGSPAIWRVPEVRKQAIEILEGYERYHQGKPEVSLYLACHAAVEYLNKDNRRAREQLDRIPGAIPPRGFGRFGLSSSECVEEIYMECFADREAISDIYRAENQNARKASAVLAKIMAGLDPKQRMHEILAKRKAAADLLVAYDSGEWVSLIGDSGLAAWYLDDPVLTDDNKLKTYGGAVPFRTISRLRLPDRHYEIVLKFTVIEKTSPRIWFGLEFGVEKNGFAVAVETAKPEHINLRTPGAKWGSVEAPPTDTIDMHIIYFDGAPELAVNRFRIPFLVTPDMDLSKLPASNRLRLGTVHAGEACPRVEVQEMKIRKLQEKPK